MKIKTHNPKYPVTLKLTQQEAEDLYEYLNITEVRYPDEDDEERTRLNKFGWDLWEQLGRVL